MHITIQYVYDHSHHTYQIFNPVNGHHSFIVGLFSMELTLNISYKLSAISAGNYEVQNPLGDSYVSVNDS